MLHKNLQNKKSKKNKKSLVRNNKVSSQLRGKIKICVCAVQMHIHRKRIESERTSTRGDSPIHLPLYL